MTLEWMHIFLAMFNASVLSYVVWAQLRGRRTPPIVPRCLITREGECLLLRDPAILCGDCRKVVVARAHDARASAHE